MQGIPFPESLREATLERLEGPNPPTLTELALELGISRTTIYRWRVQTQKDAMKIKPPLSPHTRSPQEKLRLVIAADGLEGAELGHFLRKEGIHLTDLEAWRNNIIHSLQHDQKRINDQDVREEYNLLKRELKSTQSELRRKEAALAETAALLVLSKKVQRLWEAEESTTIQNSVSRSSK